MASSLRPDERFRPFRRRRRHHHHAATTFSSRYPTWRGKFGAPAGSRLGMTSKPQERVIPQSTLPGDYRAAGEDLVVSFFLAAFFPNLRAAAFRERGSRHYLFFSGHRERESDSCVLFPSAAENRSSSATVRPGIMAGDALTKRA